MNPYIHGDCKRRQYYSITQRQQTHQAIWDIPFVEYPRYGDKVGCENECRPWRWPVNCGAYKPVISSWVSLSARWEIRTRASCIKTAFLISFRRFSVFICHPTGETSNLDLQLQFQLLFMVFEQGKGFLLCDVRQR